MNIIVNGAMGRMGQAVIARLNDTGETIAAMVDPQCDAAKGFRTLKEVTFSADALIDFSSPKALDDVLDYAVRHNTPVVLATTGYSAQDIQKINAASEKVALFKSANMSLGINVLKQLITQAAKVLGDDFDVEIVETHHNKKADAPSGTALLLYDALEKAYEGEREMMPGRHGTEATRAHKEIGIHAVRGGTVPGIHEVGFYGYNEVLTLTHSAQSREVFAIGAVRAAKYLYDIGAKDKPQLYAMEQLIGTIV